MEGDLRFAARRGDMGEDNNDRTLVAAIINMARSMELTVIAERVETQHQLDLLDTIFAPGGGRRDRNGLPAYRAGAAMSGRKRSAS
jgi:hypothetical protein